LCARNRFIMQWAISRGVNETFKSSASAVVEMSTATIAGIMENRRLMQHLR
jgi:hypothetical protein